MVVNHPPRRSEILFGWVLIACRGTARKIPPLKRDIMPNILKDLIKLKNTLNEFKTGFLANKLSIYESTEKFKDVTDELRNILNNNENLSSYFSMNEATQKSLIELIYDINTVRQEILTTYNNRIERLRNNFFQNQTKIPLPTAREQWDSWEIFPSDPDIYPQYYCYDFK